MTESVVELNFPFRGWWRARNSPARRVPSHGSHLFGTTYAIDFIGLDESGRSAPLRPAGLFRTEPPESFPGFGRELLAPVAGRVVLLHDGEIDHAARRSQWLLARYLLSQRRRLREGGEPAITGNLISIALTPAGPFVSLMHLKLGSSQVRVGQQVELGEPIAACGNSGNSTQPHLHLQVTDSLDFPTCHGLPITFRTAEGSPVRLPQENEVFRV